MRYRTHELPALADDGLWYKDAVIYELHVRAFCDANGDGIGDFNGLITKLDYLQDLGVTALWLLPFYPSPLRDDGYDIADYTKVNPSYGELRHFRRFLKEAHRRGLRVITELVINHTSVDHPWFQRARRAPAGSCERDYYVWTDDPERYADARIIFKDFETSNWTWDPVAGAYYWHRFYHHQPDLNFENPAVQEAVFNALDFWLDMGVDGMRLDAVPYLYQQEGTNCENLPQTHEFLKRLRKHVDSKYAQRLLLAEANQWPEDAAAYFGVGDECHMNFHFPLMPRLFMSVQLESSYPIHDILEQTPAIADNCQWALFLRNHDELTLEMVTDEDRDYMYRVYAADPQARVNLGIRRRLAPLLLGRRKVELLNALLMSLPGTPVLYYGDEIGMGDNVYLGDRNAVRTPMQWSADRNAGFSRANPQRLFLPPITDPEYHYEAVNVEAQQDNPSSLLWWMKRLIGLRKQTRVFGRGDVTFLHPDNSKVLAFVRSFEHESVLVVANLSRYVQCVELDLTNYQGMVPVEMFGRTEFPPIGALPYFLTLGPHSFYWFSLEQPEQPKVEVPAPLPHLSVDGAWQAVVGDPLSSRFKAALLGYLTHQRWYRGGARKRKAVGISERIPLAEGRVQMLFAQVSFVEGPPETYVVPITCVSEEVAAGLPAGSQIATIEFKDPSSGSACCGVLADASGTAELVDAVLDLFGRSRRAVGRHGRLMSTTFARVSRLVRNRDQLSPDVQSGGRHNTCVAFGERAILKLFRLLEDGVSPDLEVGRALGVDQRFDHVPQVAAALQYHSDGANPAAVAMLQRFVPNQGTAWQVWVDALGRYYEQVITHRNELQELRPVFAPTLDGADIEIPKPIDEILGTMLPLVRLLAQRTAELHLALASHSEDPAFSAESFTQPHRRSLYQSSRSRLKRSFDLLRRKVANLPEVDQEQAQALLSRQQEIDRRLKQIVGRAVVAQRIRIHGDLRLDQVLFTGKDFVFVDFDGDATRPIAERRFKRSPLRDVVSMLRSFHHVTEWELQHDPGRPEDLARISSFARVWRNWLALVYVQTYLRTARPGGFLPTEEHTLTLMLEFYTLDKCLDELERALNRQVAGVRPALDGLAEALEIEPDRI